MHIFKYRHTYVYIYMYITFLVVANSPVITTYYMLYTSELGMLPILSTYSDCKQKIVRF